MKFRFTERGHWLNPRPGLYVPGWDFGPKGLHIIKDFGEYLILKNPGHTGWSGIGMTNYYPTDYRIVRVMYWDAEYTYVEEVDRPVEPGRKWRACIARLTALVEQRQQEVVE